MANKPQGGTVHLSTTPGTTLTTEARAKLDDLTKELQKSNVVVKEGPAQCTGGYCGVKCSPECGSLKK